MAETSDKKVDEMYEDVVKNIDEIINSITGNITTYKTTLKLKNLKWEDSIKDINNSRNDKNVSNDELYDKFHTEIRLKDELEKYKNQTKDYDGNIEFYNLIVERYEEKKKEYKKLLDKKNKLLTTNPKDKKEEERIKFQIEEINKDLAHIISSIQALVKPLNELKEKFNVTEEIKNKTVEETKNKTTSEQLENQEKTLEELADLMSVDEMNTILNMISSNNRDQNVLDSIAKRLGVDVSKLEEIAKLKEKKLKEQEKENNNVNSDAKEKETDKSEPQQNEEEQEKTSKHQVDTKPEPKKKPTKIAQISNLLKNKVNGKALIAVLAIAGTLAVFLANPALVLAAGVGYAAKQFSNGKKL